MEKKTWKDITLGQFKELTSITEVKDEYMMCNIIDLVYGTDSSHMPLSEFNEYLDAVSFMNEDIKPVKRLPERVTLNGRIYDTGCNLTEVSVAQYIDYQNYCKREKVSYNDMLSVIVIPEGRRYNDGYNMTEVKADMDQMPIDLVVSLCFFLTRQYQLFTETFQTCLKEKLKMMKIPEKEKQKALELLDNLDFSNLESFRT